MTYPVRVRVNCCLLRHRVRVGGFYYLEVKSFETLCGQKDLINFNKVFSDPRGGRIILSTLIKSSQTLLAGGRILLFLLMSSQTLKTGGRILLCTFKGTVSLDF